MTSPIGPITSAQPSLGQETAQRQRLDRILHQLLEATPGEKPAVNPEALIEPVKRINQVLRRYGVEFQLGGEPPRVITRIVDVESGETIRQIPSEEVLRIAGRIHDIVGRLIELEA